MEEEKFKLAKKEFGIIKNRVQQDSPPVEVPLKVVVEKLQEGKSVSPTVMKGTKEKDFVEQQVFMVDIDNKKTDIPILTVEKAISICEKNHLPLAFYYFSFSHTEKLEKYRLVFVMDKVITDKVLRDTIIRRLIDLFEQADTSCTNADRVFFGTNKEAKILDLKARITVDNILVRDNPRYIMFENCEICVHKNDLVYYPETNSFSCFSDKGKKEKIGGTIIDYLMAVEHLSQKEAIEKFKKELCGIGKVPKSISLKELLEMDIEPPHVVVEDMLYQGLTIVAGAPKVGKSWLCLDLGISLCNGKSFLGLKTNKCGCLYLALEDSYYRLQERAKKVLKAGDTIPKDFRLKLLASPLNEGLLEELQEELKENPNTKLIIIDTLQKIRGTPNKADTMYGYDYKEMSKIKSFADEHKICIVVIHHLKKGNESDTFDKINGSTGLRGAVDTTIVLEKIKDKKEVVFSIEGRDVENNEKLLLFNKETFKWEVVCSDLEARKDMTDIERYNINPIVITIKKLIEENPTGVKINASDLLKKIFEITGTYPKEDKPNTLSREITSNLQYNLLKYDGIHYEHKARILFFSKPKVEE